MDQWIVGLVDWWMNDGRRFASTNPIIQKSINPLFESVFIHPWFITSYGFVPTAAAALCAFPECERARSFETIPGKRFSTKSTSASLL